MSKIFSRHAGSSHASTQQEGTIQIATVAQALAGTDQFKAITPAALEARISQLIGGAPELLDTLKEISDAINSDENFAVTVNGQIASLQSQINTLSGTNLGNLTNEIDAIEAGAGLNADGTYTAPSGTNHLGSSTSLKNADTLLDAQIKQNADDIASLGNGSLTAIQTEIDEIESSVGLGTDGTLGSYANNNNYSASASIKAAIEGVDAQVATNTAAISSLGSNAAISALQSELDATQASAGLNANGSLGSFTTPIVGSSASLKAAIDDIADYVGQVSPEGASLSADVSAAQSDIDTLQSNVTTLQSNVSSNDSDIASINSTISGLASSSALSTLQSEVDATQAGVGLNANGTYSAISGANYATSSSSLKAAVGQLDTQLESTQSDLDTLETTVSNLQTGAPNQAEVDAIEASVGINANGTFSANTGGNFIASASSVRGEINALDTQLNTTQNDLDTAEASLASLTTTVGNKADSSVVTALSSTVDTVEASVGLTSSGGFTANSGGNFIASATSVRGEINALDTQVQTNAGDISNLSSSVNSLTSSGSANATEITNLENELDATQAGAGLGTTGAYAANSGSNFLTSASSLKDADDKLDAQIKTNADAIALRATSSTVSAIDTRLTSAESAITSNDSDISSIQSDVTANTTAIGNNDSDISALQSGKADTSVTTALQSELDATQAGAGLGTGGAYTAPGSSNYLGATSSIVGALGSLDSQIKTNENAITSNDSDISSNASSISSLQTLANTHEASIGLDANGGYSAISGANFADSATSLKAAVAQLDTQLKTTQDEVDAEETARANAITAVNSSISTLQSEVDATQTGAGLTSAGAYTANSSSNYIQSVSSLKAADDALDAQIKINENAISSNDSDISSINSTISTLATSSSVSALQSEVDATQSGVGLAANGSYSAISGANYATSSSNLKAAVQQLDTQLESTQSDLDTAEASISAQSSLLDTHEASIGLSAAGAYVSRSGSNYLDSASSVVGESSLLDAQIKTNETAIATKASTSSLNTLQTEVDGIETAVGLSSSGAFVSHSGTNYIDGASSIKGSLELLDTAVKARETAITSEAATRLANDNTLATSINTVEASVGLQTDGSLSISGTNFLNSSATIVSALSTLDTNQKLLSDIRTNMIASLGLSTTGEKNNYANTNYISNSEDVIEAIEALDRQVNTNESAISSLGSSNIANLQSELDTTQSGVGLATIGAHVARSGTNYLDSAGSIVAEITALDTQVKTNETAIATKANSTTLSALDLRVTQLENSDGGVWSDDDSNDEVFYEFKAECVKSHYGPFEIKLGGANGYIRALVADANATTDLIFYGSKAERDGGRHFHIHPTSGDGVFQGKFAS